MIYHRWTISETLNQVAHAFQAKRDVLWIDMYFFATSHCTLCMHEWLRWNEQKTKEGRSKYHESRLAPYFFQFTVVTNFTLGPNSFQTHSWCRFRFKPCEILRFRIWALYLYGVRRSLLSTVHMRLSGVWEWSEERRSELVSFGWTFEKLNAWACLSDMQEDHEVHFLRSTASQNKDIMWHGIVCHKEGFIMRVSHSFATDIRQFAVMLKSLMG